MYIYNRLGFDQYPNQLGVGQNSISTRGGLGFDRGSVEASLATISPSLRGCLQGYLAHKKMPTLLGPPLDPRHRSTVGSQGGAFSYERGTPVGCTKL